MVNARIIVREGDKYLWGDGTVFFDRSPAEVLSNDISWKIIRAIAERPKYARQIARELSLNEQSVYYHIKKLLSCGVIEVVEEQSVRGARAKKVFLSNDGIVILFKSLEKASPHAYGYHDKLCRFFSDFVEGGMFLGYIVVGSPEPHGPFRAVARDGHYAAHLSYFLGKCSTNLGSFMVRLDTDIKAERLYDENLILIGGPITNMITSEVNQYLPVKFVEPNYWSGLVDQEGVVYNGETDALISKVRNPFNEEKSVVVVAGIRHLGTKSAIIGLTEFSEQVLRTYSGQTNYSMVLRGYDQDGDGKVDHVEVLRTYTSL
ncbi:MAG: ArsR family transcriptional regulator [Nitrososphaeria archaeon]